MISSNSSKRLILVCIPSGYGKTTRVSDYTKSSKDKNQTLIGENTYIHIKDKIKSKMIGLLTFKGKSKPFDVYMVGENKTSRTSSGGRKQTFSF